MKCQHATPILVALTLGVSEAALAYVGPGAGLSLLGALWGLLLAIGAALGFVIFWPIRRARRRAKARREAQAMAPPQGENAEHSDPARPQAAQNTSQRAP